MNFAPQKGEQHFGDLLVLEYLKVELLSLQILLKFAIFRRDFDGNLPEFQIISAILMKLKLQFQISRKKKRKSGN